MQPAALEAQTYLVFVLSVQEPCAIFHAPAQLLLILVLWSMRLSSPSLCLYEREREREGERASAYSLLVPAAVETGEDKVRESGCRETANKTHTLCPKKKNVKCYVHNKFSEHYSYAYLELMYFS